MTAIAAVDVALWDIKAKAAAMPLYQILGGASRNKVEVYGHANGETIDETVEETGRYLDRGYRSVRAQCGVPGLDSTYGVAGDKGFYEPADARLPTENFWETAPYLEQVPRLFAKLRESFGAAPRLLHDVHHRLRPIEAARLGRDLEPFRLFWLEDAIPAENQEAFACCAATPRRRSRSARFSIRFGIAKRSSKRQLIDYLRASVVHAGRYHSFAAHGRFRRALQCPHRLPRRDRFVADYDGRRLAFRFVEFPISACKNICRTPKKRRRFSPRAYRFESGFMHPGDAPGHGVDIDEKAAAKFPYAPASLPINRLRDGAMWDW